MSTNKGTTTVCVTGGTGFIASSLITQLLHRGYTVNSTLRPNSVHQRDVTHLTTLPGAPDRLHLFEATLEDPTTFLPAFRGCTGVFHVAHLRDGNTTCTKREDQDALVERAVAATRGVLRACVDSGTVKKVVFTSSLGAAVPKLGGGNGVGLDVVDEGTWTDVDSYRNVVDPAAFRTLSVKTATEKAALEFAERNGMDLVTLLPSVVVGPFLCPDIPLSVKRALGLVLGNNNELYRLSRFDMVHVEDVVGAHIFVFECGDAKGRYICSSHNVTSVEMWDFLSTRYPHLQLPSKESLKSTTRSDVARVSSQKLMDRGFEFKHGLGDMMDGAIKSCIEKGFM